MPLAALLGEPDGLVPSATSKLKRAMAAVRDDRAAGADAPAADITPEAEAVGTDGAVQADTTVEADEAEPRLTAGKTPGVVADDHLAEAGRKVLRFHLARMIAREAGAREGTVNEELHGMRVATRRQRAAWRVFGDAFDQERTARHQRRLKEVARDLGAVRDLDVLIEAGEAYQKDLPAEDGASFEPLLADWRGQRDAARLVLIKESLTRGATSAGSTTTSRSCRPRASMSGSSDRSSHTACGTRCRRGSGPPTRACAGTSRSCSGPMSRRSTISGSPRSGCATRSSSCARRSGRIRRP